MQEACCDLLYYYYFCSMNHASYSFSNCTHPVVICFIIITFAV